MARKQAGWGRLLVLRLKGQSASSVPGSTMRSVPHEDHWEPPPRVSVPKLEPIRDPSLLLYSELAGWCEGPGE
jgi:hypothetical protein